MRQATKLAQNTTTMSTITKEAKAWKIRDNSVERGTYTHFLKIFLPVIRGCKFKEYEIYTCFKTGISKEYITPFF